MDRLGRFTKVKNDFHASMPQMAMKPKDFVKSWVDGAKTLGNVRKLRSGLGSARKETTTSLSLSTAPLSLVSRSLRLRASLKLFDNFPPPTPTFVEQRPLVISDTKIPR